MSLRIIITIILNLFAASALANQGTVEPSDILLTPDISENINRKIVYFVDSENRFDVKDVLSKKVGWIKPVTDNVALDLEKRTIWVKVLLRNSTDDPLKTYFELDPSFLERIDLYDQQGKHLSSTGSTIPSDQIRAFPTLEFTIQPGLQTYYVAIASRGNTLSLVLRSHDVFIKKTYNDLIIIGLLFGALSALLIYHLFQFLVYRSANFLYFSLFIACVALFTISFTSYQSRFLPEYIGSISMGFWWSGIGTNGASISIYLFSAHLLRLFPGRQQRRKKISYLMCLFPILSLCSLVAIFTEQTIPGLVLMRGSIGLQMLVWPAVGFYLWLFNRKDYITIIYSISWVPFNVGTLSILAYLANAGTYYDFMPWVAPVGAIVQSLFLSFAAGHNLKNVTDEKIRETSAKLLVMDELQKSVRKLEARDNVITSFVSSEIVKELDIGNDPLSFTPRNVEKCVIFLDMRDYTSFSENYTPIQCYEVVNEYFKLINQVIFENGGRVDKIIGDAMMIVFDDPHKCLAAIVKLRFALSSKNRERIDLGLIPLKFGLGVHCGTMLQANFGSSEKLDRTLVGDTVNVASRLESITKIFAVDVLCSKEFVDLFPDYDYFRPAAYVLLKGRKKKSLVFEMFEHNASEVVQWKIYSRPFINEAIELELNAKYSEALKIVLDLISKCPAHNHKPGMIMDPTLIALVEAVKEKLKSLEISVLSDFSVKTSA